MINTKHTDECQLNVDEKAQKMLMWSVNQRIAVAKHSKLPNAADAYRFVRKTDLLLACPAKANAAAIIYYTNSQLSDYRRENVIPLFPPDTARQNENFFQS
ncbi:conserved hypothetical protein [Trichinella spiralis]|uniref:hypothetical protein n=1 Tax=Trichinella spiralis TaxID=6334 RepID=UPI0001EFC023|nr:conserved hypothetical protein [Trichinella spiralis]